MTTPIWDTLEAAASAFEAPQATKQTRAMQGKVGGDCFAALAMTARYVNSVQTPVWP